MSIATVYIVVHSKWLNYWDCVKVEPYLVSKLCGYELVEVEEVYNENVVMNCLRTNLKFVIARVNILLLTLGYNIYL